MHTYIHTYIHMSGFGSSRRAARSLRSGRGAGGGCVDPVRIARIHVTRLSPRVGLPRNLFLIGSLSAALRFSKGWVRKDPNLGLRTGCRPRRSRTRDHSRSRKRADSNYVYCDMTSCNLGINWAAWVACVRFLERATAPGHRGRHILLLLLLSLLLLLLLLLLFLLLLIINIYIYIYIYMYM